VRLSWQTAAPIDGTPALAAKLGARVVESPKGRGLQIRKGVESASGDVIVILHADCAAKSGVFKRMLKKLESDPYKVGGSVGMQFERNNPKTVVIAFLNNLRTFLAGMPSATRLNFSEPKPWLPQEDFLQ
jgi:glycosyltransferase involved in cell wall biosynthesis